VSSQGQTSDLILMIAVGVGVGAVSLAPGSGLYTTMAQVAAAYDANLPSCTAPLTKTDTMQSTGWLLRVFGCANASQTAVGAGRPATSWEIANGAAAAGAYAYPWISPSQLLTTSGLIQPSFLPARTARLITASGPMLSGDADGLVESTGSATAQTLTMLAATGYGGRTFTFVNGSTQSWEVWTPGIFMTQGAIAVTGSMPQVLIVPAGQSIVFQSDGSNWAVIGGSMFTASLLDSTGRIKNALLPGSDSAPLLTTGAVPVSNGAQQQMTFYNYSGVDFFTENLGVRGAGPAIYFSSSGTYLISLVMNWSLVTSGAANVKFIPGIWISGGGGGMIYLGEDTDYWGAARHGRGRRSDRRHAESSGFRR
jgi:hypothetical protein